MKWMLVVLFLTSGRYDAGVDLNVFRFYTEEGCITARQYIKQLKTYHKNNKYRGGVSVVSDYLKEK